MFCDAVVISNRSPKILKSTSDYLNTSVSKDGSHLTLYTDTRNLGQEIQTQQLNLSMPSGIQTSRP
ncbi:predicted protein [Sclerotinia sclerotiorum 1980 UF-70]|uniref:Uncharacterized protein n=1 Tax=Sclerotinia sclerotiorum (strain ATCC 18683 / 1980 / Ss-1) TaxID=665079 RepID=A7F4Q2_SCLS1|nr:predicted protein [Sclerotinia sclerotiorum 1980 UF-70]EDN97723.1 predicted protein [Sclerotinia sclerotiorum 1980 UF-70]